MSASPSASPSVAVKPSLTLKRRLNAPPEKVYAAWTKPEQIARWFGGQEVLGVTAEADLRVDVRYHINMRTRSDEHDVSGTYREIVPNEKLVFTWAWKTTPERASLVTVTLKPDGAGTMLTLLHEQFFDEPARDRHQQGWSGALDKLERLFA
jgi:uncharacterized protein YndB with AHSA1/START domain